MTIVPSLEPRILRDALPDWTDRDVAAFQLAKVLGIFEANVDFATDAKFVFWSDNALGVSLDQILRVLVSLGALELDDEQDRLRWNRQFDWKAPSLTKGPSSK